VNQYTQNMENSRLGIGYGSGTAGSTQPCDPPPRPRLDLLCERLENLPKVAGGALERVQRMADRLGGPVPTPVEKEGGVATGGSVAANLENSITLLDNLLGKLHAQLDRLERF
jgi:hypothetical protein